MIDTNNLNMASSINYHDLLIRINDIFKSDVTSYTPVELIDFVSEHNEPKSKALVLNWVLSNLPLLFKHNDADFNHTISNDALFNDNTETIAKYLVANPKMYQDLFTNFPKQFAYLLCNYSYTFCDYSSLYNCLFLQKVIDDLNTLPHNNNYTLIAVALTNINSGAGTDYEKLKQKITIKIPEYYYHQILLMDENPLNHGSINPIDDDIIVTLTSKDDVNYLLANLLSHRIKSQTTIIIVNDKIKSDIISYIELLDTCKYSKELNKVKAKLQALV